MISEISEIKDQFEVTRQTYRKYLPKVDPELLDDLFRRQMENPGVAPMYLLEVFLEPGISSERVRDTVLWETGVTPAIYDHGTHVAAHHPLTLEMLEKISNKEGVLEITGEYQGDTGSWAASHERRNQ
jgi:hypothetical protein